MRQISRFETVDLIMVQNYENYLTRNALFITQNPQNFMNRNATHSSTRRIRRIL